MINSSDILKKIPGIKPKDADSVAREINLLAEKYRVDTNEITNLLDMKPKDLQIKIIEVKDQRKQLKEDIRQSIMKE